MSAAVKKRAYGQFCSAARALDVVGERWTLLIVRNLLLGPRRYTDLIDELPGITTNLLAKRLKEMQAAGLIDRNALAPPHANVYSLTERGKELEPVLVALARWGGPLMQRPQRGDTINPGWSLLSLKTLYRGGLELELELRVDGRTFELLFLSEYLRIQERPATRPAAVVTASIAALGRLFLGGESLTRLLKEGVIALTGSTRAFQSAVDATALSRR